MGRLSETITRGAHEPYAQAVDAVKVAEIAERVRLGFAINQTDLLAPTSQELIAPVDGYIVGLYTTVQLAPTTGGPITVLVGTTTVTGLSVAIADGAAKGTVQSDTIAYGTATAKVKKGDRIQIAPDAAFATAGAVSGFVEIVADAAG